FDDLRVVSGGSDGRVKIWDVSTGTLVRELSQPAEAVWRVAFESERCVVMASRSGRTIMEVWDFTPPPDDEERRGIKDLAMTTEAVMPHKEAMGGDMAMDDDDNMLDLPPVDMHGTLSLGNEEMMDGYAEDDDDAMKDDDHDA
ncbi:MAG: hypothetical protein Q9183_004796, partial [Haloplaca sp. 2 TL-2023]